MRSRLLVVDDDQEVREALVEELSDRYHVESAPSGRMALQCLDGGKYDAVISDLRMPDLDGLTVLQHAVERDPDVIRILLTGYSDQDTHRVTMRPGAPYKIGKPWHDEIAITLRRAFEERDMRRQLTAGLSSAMDLIGVDDQLAAQEGLVGIGKVMTEQFSRMRGVLRSRIAIEVHGRTQLLGTFEAPDAAGQRPDWIVDELLGASDGPRATVEGLGHSAEQLTRVLVEHARHWVSQDPMSQLVRRASVDPAAQQHLLALARRASVGTMAASMHHELASLLNIVLFGLEELSPLVHDCHTDEGQIESLEHSIDATKRAVALFSAIRSYVHEGMPIKQTVRVDRLVDQAVTLCSSRAGRAYRIVVQPGQQPVLVDGISTLLVQVLVNLLRNAIEASPSEGRIDVEIRPDGEFVAICITDDGPGVPPEKEDQLFQPFFTTKGPERGTGLGLAFAARTVEEHGGKLAYERRPGRGATFVVRLPLHQ